jgi:hypothetical protein
MTLVLITFNLSGMIHFNPCSAAFLLYKAAFHLASAALPPAAMLPALTTLRTTHVFRLVAQQPPTTWSTCSLLAHLPGHPLRLRGRSPTTPGRSRPA